MLPPPNVTGSLHMGHAFQDSIMDLLIRYHKMQGINTHWQGGTDHAGIATQMVVERQLQQHNISKHDLGREEFIKKIWEWKEQSGNTIVNQMQRLGTSIDWQQAKFTMDESMSHAVTTAFIKLYDDDLIYRGKRLVNWDPILQTAVSDLEVISKEEQGSLWYIKYPLTNNSNKFITIATTRPETMLGDVAIAVHPEDARFKHLIGTTANLPLCDRAIPIIADSEVNPEFGTGCVKITPAHDFNDYLMGQRHSLPSINIFNSDATINNHAPTAYQNLDRFKARKNIIKDLENLKLLVIIQDHTLKIPRGDRTNAIIEPYLTDQWFVTTKSLAKPAIKAVQDGAIKFIPENWDKTYFNWMENIEDWCISRQLWWGHRIPAWFDAAGKIYVAESEAAVRKKYNLAANITLTQDNDVLDTWFSSALWPFATLGWPEQTAKLDKFFPTNVLVTGFDIIFFWVARMIMFSLYFTNKVPFKEVYIHGLIQDSLGQKMSKSKGNVIDPLDLIDGIALDKLIAKRTKGLMQPDMATKITRDTKKQFPNGIPTFGVDALRFTLCSLATGARHIKFSLERIEGNRNFINKIANAIKFILMQPDNTAPTLSTADKWIVSIWQDIKQRINHHLQNYRFDLACQEIYDFVWHEYCAWYLEFNKVALNKQLLLSIMQEILLVLHPIIPNITTELLQQIAPNIDISKQTYPQSDPTLIDPSSITEVNWVKDFITHIRNIRGEMNITPKKLLQVLLQDGTEPEQQIIIRNKILLLSIAKLDSLEYLAGSASAPKDAATAILGSLNIIIPLEGVIDLDQKRKRLEKEIAKLETELKKANTKLDNPNYIKNAPKEVVVKERERAAAIQQQLVHITNNKSL